MRHVKRLALLLVITAALIGTARFTHHQTHGFRLSKIHNNLCEEKAWIAHESPPCDLLAQRYHYLSRGLQSFVFASEDGNYVIKLFNNRYQRLIAWYGLLSHFPVIGSWAQEKHAYFHSKLLRTFSSYRIAHEELHETTGLVFSHLNQTTDLPNQLIIVDPLHIEHRIDPNNYGFIVQKRAQMVYPTLLSYIKEGKISEAKEAISSLIELFALKYQKGIADNDPLIRTNYGFIEDKPVQIDIGPFSKDPRMADPEVCNREILKATASLGHWLDQHCPELTPFLEEATQSIEKK